MTWSKLFEICIGCLYYGIIIFVLLPLGLIVGINLLFAMTIAITYTSYIGALMIVFVFSIIAHFFK